MEPQAVEGGGIKGLQYQWYDNRNRKSRNNEKTYKRRVASNNKHLLYSDKRVKKSFGCIGPINNFAGKKENVNTFLEENIGVSDRECEWWVRWVARGCNKRLQSTESFRW